MSKKRIETKTVDYHTRLIEDLTDKEEAVAYLKVALEEYEFDRDLDAFMLALRNVAEAQGGITELAKKSNLNRPNLYRVLSGKGNPRLLTLYSVLTAMGFRLSVEAA